MASQTTEQKPDNPDEKEANSEGEAPANLQDAQNKPAKKTELAILNFVLKYLKLVGGALLIWFMGWLGLSYVWIVCGFFVYVLWRMNQEERKSRRDAFRETVEKEQQVVEARMEDLPSWVSFRLLKIFVLHYAFSQMYQFKLSLRFSEWKIIISLFTSLIYQIVSVVIVTNSSGNDQTRFLLYISSQSVHVILAACKLLEHFFFFWLVI